MIVHSSVVPEMERYEINLVTGCWLWLGYVNKDGYARLDRENAHAIFYRIHVGPVVEGNDVDHLCKRRNCVNPAHLESVPELENILRRSRTVTYQGRSFDICRNGHALEGDNVRVSTRANGMRRRVCVECQYLANSSKARARAEAEGRQYRPYKRRVSSAA